MSENKDRVLNIPALLQGLWQRRLVFIIIFLVVAVVGSLWAFSRKGSYEASQLTVLTVPAVTSEAESIQQSSVLGGMPSTYLALLKEPLIGDPVLAKHPEIPSLDALATTVTITSPSPLTLQISTSDTDPAKAEALVRDVSQSLAENSPKALEQYPPHLQMRLHILDTVATKDVPSGRLSMIIVVVCLAFVAAACGTAAWPRRR